MPSEMKKKTFEEIKEKKEEEKVKVGDDRRRKKVQNRARKWNADVPRENKEKHDHKIATNTGILALLKASGIGTGGDASSVLGGSVMASLDESLDGLSSPGMGDPGGFSGLPVRGSGPGGGGPGLGLGGLRTPGYGPKSNIVKGSAPVGHRDKARLSIGKGRTRISGGLPREVVGRYIQRYRSRFKYCYQNELSRNPNLYGKVTTHFTISGNGRVSEAQAIRTTLNNTNVEQCLLRAIRSISFPPPRGGGEVIVTYPFLFSTAG